MNKKMVMALLAGSVVAGCASGPDVLKVGRDTYMMTQSGYAVSKGGPTSTSGYSNVTNTVELAATQYCAGRGETMSVVSTTGTAEIQDPQGGLFAGGVSGYVEVKLVFQCSPAKQAPGTR